MSKAIIVSVYVHGCEYDSMSVCVYKYMSVWIYMRVCMHVPVCACMSFVCDYWGHERM